MVPSLADHAHHLPVADLHDILLVDLWGRWAVVRGLRGRKDQRPPLQGQQMDGEKPQWLWGDQGVLLWWLQAG